MSVTRVDPDTRLLIERNAARFGIDPNLLEALIVTRTGGGPDVVTTLPPLPAESFFDLSGAWTRLFTLQTSGNPGVRNVTLLKDQQAKYFVDLFDLVAQVVVTTTEIAADSNLALQVFLPDPQVFSPSLDGYEQAVSATGTGNNTAILSTTSSSPLNRGTYRIIVTALADSTFDLEFQPIPDPYEIQRFGLAQLSLSQARRVGFSGVGPDLEDPDTNLGVAAQLIKDALIKCKGAKIPCVMEKFLGVPSTVSVQSLARGVEYNFGQINFQESTPTTISTGPSQSAGGVKREKNVAVRDVFTNMQTTFNPPCAQGPTVEPLNDFPMPPNPFFATFEIEINGFVVAPQRPQYVTYFEIMEQLENFSSELRLRLFDPDWTVLEGTVTGGGGQFRLDQYAEVIVTFGYATRGPEHSPFGAGPDPLYDSGPKSFFMSDYSVHFLGNGVEIELYAKSADFFMGLNERFDTYKHDNIEDIVRGPLQERYQWDDVCFEPVEEVRHFGVERAAYTPRRWVQPGVSDAQFLDYFLLPNAKSQLVEHGTAYSRFYDTTTKTMHCHEMPFGANPVRTYTYARRRVGSVIEWRPQILGTANLLWGGGASTSQNMNMHSGEVQQHQSDPWHANEYNESPDNAKSELSSSNIPGFEGTDRDENMAGRKVQYPSDNWLEMSTQAMQERMHSAYFAAQGVLTVIGDPLIGPFKQIYLTVQHNKELPDGSALTLTHPTSGLWMINRVTHVIQGGEYVTILEIMRSAAPQPDGYIPPALPPKGLNLKSTGDPSTLANLDPTILGREGLLGGRDGGGGGGGPPPGPFFDPGPGFLELTGDATSIPGVGWVGVDSVTINDGQRASFYYDLLEDSSMFEVWLRDVDDQKYVSTDLVITPPPGSLDIPGIDVITAHTDRTNRYVQFPSVGGSFAPKGTWLIELTNVDITSGSSGVDTSFALASLGVRSGPAIVGRDLSERASASSLELTSPVSGVDGARGVPAVSAVASTTQEYHFTVGAAENLSVVIGPESPMDVTIDIDPPAVTGISRRSVRDSREIRVDFGNGITSLGGTWRVTVTTHTASDYKVYWIDESLTRTASSQAVRLDELAPNGSIDLPLYSGGWYGREQIQIPNGTTKRFYASVKPPNVPDGLNPRSIEFEWHDESGLENGSLQVSVAQATGAKIAVTGGPSPSGILRFLSGATQANGNKPTKPEEVALGYYIVTATGVKAAPGSDLYRLAWRVKG